MLRRIPNVSETDVLKQIACSVKAPNPVLLCTDYDGTLVPFTTDFANTNTPSRVLDTLEGVADSPRVEVAIISGRSLIDLERLVPLQKLTLAGLHGAQIRFSDGERYCWPGIETVVPTLNRIKDGLYEVFRDYNGVFIEDKHYGIAVHFRQYPGGGQRVRDTFHGLVREKGWNGCSGLQVLEGAKVIELRPQGPDKGTALHTFRERMCSEGCATAYIGDDTTDEDAFRVLTDLTRDYPILVSEETNVNSCARYRLDDSRQVHGFLNKLLRTIS